MQYDIYANAYKSNQVDIYAVQGESKSRIVTFSIIEKSGIISATSNAKVTNKMLDLTDYTPYLYIIKPDKKLIFATGTVVDASNGVVSFVLPYQATTAAGTADCVIMLVKEDTNLRITGISLNIEAANIDGTIESTDDFSALQDALSSINNVNKRIDNIIANSSATEGNTELIDIRNGSDGTVYISAGSAVRSQISDVNRTLDEHQTDLIKLCGHIYYNSYDFGAINSTNNVDVPVGKTRIRTASPIPFERGIRLIFNRSPRPVFFIWLNSSNEYISCTSYITGKSIELSNYAPTDTASFRFFIKYDSAGEQEFTDQELIDISEEIEIIKTSLTDDILESKNNLPHKVDKREISVSTASENSVNAKNTDFSIFSSFISDSSRYVSDYEIEKECFLTSLTVPVNSATSCHIICGEMQNNTFSLHHDFGSFTITNGQTVINDRKYLLKPGERVFIKFTGGFYYKAENNLCFFLTNNRTYDSTGHYIISYDLILTDATNDIGWLSKYADIIGSFRGKTYVAYGDSITAGYGLDGYEENRQFSNTSVNVYSKLAAEDLKMNYYNFGYSAHGYSVQPNYTFADLIEKHHTDADVVTVAMGTNDYGLADSRNVSFGNIADTTTATFCGSIRAAFDKLMKYYPKAEIIILLPLPRANMSANGQGKTLYDYADTIKQIAGEYGFPVIDLLREGGVHHKSSAFMSEYSMDGLHWNENFHKEYIYPRVKNALIHNAIIR